MLVRGIGRQRDNQRGCVLLATAAAAGDADAHFFLGCPPPALRTRALRPHMLLPPKQTQPLRRYVCFCNRDHTRALNYFTTAHAATREGHASAALHLGIMYLNGYGVDEDASKAEMLFKFALERGEPDAEQAMVLLAEKRLQQQQQQQQPQQQQQQASPDSSFSGAEGTEV